MHEKLKSELLLRARQASEAAYAPYSHFRVGAAVLSGQGDIFVGCNCENASYGATICAERNAIGSLIASGQRQIITVLVYTPTSAPTTPCGICRQVINEFSPSASIVCACDGPDLIETGLEQLLPSAFGPLNLEGPR